MASADREEPSQTSSQEAVKEMEKYGITRVPIDYFYYGDFRYTNLKDAVAEAKRQQPSNESNSAIGPEALDEMVRYGITRVPIDYFSYRDFRYTNLKDAVAEAKRQQRSA